MSWLNFNDSFSNLKGQISNQITNFLTEEDDENTGVITDLTDDKRKIQELEKCCSEKDQQILALQNWIQKENDTGQKKDASETEWSDFSYPSELSEASFVASSADKLKASADFHVGGEPFQTPRLDSDELKKLKADCEHLQTLVDKKTVAEKNLEQKINVLLDENQKLKSENKELAINLTQLDEDCQQTTEKLVSLRDVLQVDFNRIKVDYDVMHVKNCELQNRVAELTNLQEQFQIQKEIERKVAVKAVLEQLEAEKVLRVELEEKIAELMEENENIKMQMVRASEDKHLLRTLEKGVNEMNTQFEESINCNTHLQKQMEKLGNILNKNLKLNVEFGSINDEEMEKLENTLRSLNDSQWKVETLEKKLIESSQENSAVVSDKDDEIDHLIENNKRLSDELKYFQGECENLSANNEKLRLDLEKYHEDANLKTINEANEESVELLEVELDRSNKRIKDLETLIEEYERKNRELQNNESPELKKNDSIEEFTLIDKISETGNSSPDQINHLHEELEAIKEMLRTKTEELEQEVAKNIELRSQIKDLENQLSLKTNKLLDDIKAMKESKEEIVDHFKTEREKFIATIEAKNACIVELMEASKVKDSTAAQQIEIKQKSIDAHIENIQTLENLIKTLQAEVLELNNNIAAKDAEVKRLQNGTNEKDNLASKIEILEAQVADQNLYIVDLEASKNNNEATIKRNEQEIIKLKNEVQEMMNLINVKHNENLQYHSELQRLNAILIEQQKPQQSQSDNLLAEISSLNECLGSKSKDVDRLNAQIKELDENYQKISEELVMEQSRLKEAQALHKQQAETIATLNKKLEQLQQFLYECDEAHTTELLAAEQKNKEMALRMTEMEQRERDSSNIYTSVSIRANQQVETLQNQIRLMTQQRDDYQAKLSEAEDKFHKQEAAVTNLQCVLEQFQRDKENDIRIATEAIRKELLKQHDKQKEFQREIDVLKQQLLESKQGLKAASRLQEQLEKARHQVCSYRDEVKKLQETLTKVENENVEMKSQFDLKVDKTLVKNLVISYVSWTNANHDKDRDQILKIIGTVLGFTKDDYEKLKIGKQASWLTSLLHPGAGAINNSADGVNQQSLTAAFVRFLENESTPKPAPPLLTAATSRRVSVDNSSNPSATIPSQQSSLLLNDFLLPTFNDFAENRSSSSILKDVLKDNH